MLVTGYASGNYDIAYAGAALALTSLGYQSGHWYRKDRTDSRFEKVSELEKKVEEPDKDNALYVRRTHQLTGGDGSDTGYAPLTEPHPRDFHRYSALGLLGLSAAGLMALFGLRGSEPALYAAGATALATLSHYAGFIFGKRRAKPEYKKVSGLEEKIQAIEKGNEK